MVSPHKRPVTRKMFPFDDVIMDFVLDIDVFHVYIFVMTYLITPIFKDFRPYDWAN